MPPERRSIDRRRGGFDSRLTGVEASTRDIQTEISGNGELLLEVLSRMGKIEDRLVARERFDDRLTAAWKAAALIAGIVAGTLGLVGTFGVEALRILTTGKV